MWTWCKDATFWCIQAVYGWCGDWGLAIIIITIIFRALIYPIASRQIKSSYSMQRIQPYVKEVQTKYADDPQKMNEEMMKIYADHHFNPLSGCLPMLLQMPIFIVLYQTLLQYLPANSCFYGLVPDLTIALKTTFSIGMVYSIPYIILVALFAISTLVPMLMMPNQEKQAKFMAIFMAVFMVWIGWSAPAGVMLYWDVSQIIGIAQQLITQKIMKSEDEKLEAEQIIVEPVKVDVDRKVKKPKPTKKSR